jgi:DNA-binding transcriptional LysR family regulator
MELRQLEYFLAIAQHGNMSAAAKSLHVSQPSMSVSLRNLETELGTQLFDRKGRNLVINDDGVYLANQVKVIEGVLAESVAALSGKKTDRSATVNCVHRMPVGDTGALVNGFRTNYPQYRVRIGFPESALFARSTIDVELVAMRDRIDDSSYIFIGEDHPVLLVPSGYPLAEETSVRLADLGDEEFVVAAGHGKKHEDSYFEGGTLHYILCGRKNISPSVTCEVQWFSEALNLVDKGVGCCIGYDMSWLAGSSYHFVVKPLEDVSEDRNLYLHFVSGNKPTDAAWAFADFIQDYFDQAPMQLQRQYGYISQQQ